MGWRPNVNLIVMMAGLVGVSTTKQLADLHWQMSFAERPKSSCPACHYVLVLDQYNVFEIGNFSVEFYHDFKTTGLYILHWHVAADKGTLLVAQRCVYFHTPEKCRFCYATYSFTGIAWECLQNVPFVIWRSTWVEVDGHRLGWRSRKG